MGLRLTKPSVITDLLPGNVQLLLIAYCSTEFGCNSNYPTKRVETQCTVPFIYMVSWLQAADNLILLSE